MNAIDHEKMNGWLVLAYVLTAIVTLFSFFSNLSLQHKLIELSKTTNTAVELSSGRIYFLLILGLLIAGYGVYAAVRAGRAGARQVQSPDNPDQVPFREMAKVMQSLTAGDFTASIPAHLAQDPSVKPIVQTMEVLRAFSEELCAVKRAIVEQGDLGQRLNKERYTGQFRIMVEDMNRIIGSLTAPIRNVTSIFEQIAKGEIPKPVDCELKGDMLRLKQSADLCLAGFAGLTEVSHALHQMSLNNCSVRIQENYSGIFGKAAKSANEVQERLQSIISALNGLAKGEFKHLLEGFKRVGKRSEQDEIVPALVRTMSAIETLVDDVLMLNQAAADGRLNSRVDSARHLGDYKQVVEGMNHIFELISEPIRSTSENAASLAASAEELTAVSQQLASTAEETATQANVVSAASEQISRNVASVAAASDEMQASIREISKNANESAHVAKNAVDAANSTNETMKKLGDSSQEIGNVIKMITSIAQQTNLLALNATIEAARAGEAGKGFAVVANEVKELAKQTANATEEISLKIDAIQSDTAGAVKAIEEISSVINQINDLSSSIASAVEEQTVTTNEIGHSVNEAAQGVREIVQNISGVAKAASGTTEGANETKTASLQLSEMAARLQNSVSKFTF